MATCVREEENAFENRQRNREVEKPDKVEIAHEVTVGSLKRCRDALIKP